jgi:hypothetical protein
MKETESRMTIMVWYLMLQMESMRTTEESKPGNLKKMVQNLDKNGTSSMRMLIQRTQRKESSTKSSDFTLTDHSISFQVLVKTDILISSITETSLLRLKMEETLNSGTSINNL